MRFLDLFAGIGGFRLALEQAGHKCIGFCEIDKFARQTYKANFDTEGEVEWHDITTVTDEDVRQLGKVDLITGGFPCQAFSVAGERRGFEDTRGTLFFEIARIAKQIEPRFLLLENVKGLLSHDKGKTFATILNTLDELGYDAEWQVLNSKNFGVPQNRERVFVVGHSRRFPRREVFPITGTSGQTIKQVGNIVDTVGGDGLEPKIMQLVGDRDKPSLSLKDNAFTIPANPMSDRGQMVVQPVLTPDRAEKRQNGRRFKEPGEPMFTLTSQDRHGVLLQSKNGTFGKLNKYPLDGCGPTLTATCYKEPDMIQRGYRIPGPADINNTVRSGGRGSLTAKHNHDTIHDGVRIRRLTPLETFRLQGFPDSHHDNAKAAGVSDSQLYKQAGNAVTVNVVYEIAKRLG